MDRLVFVSSETYLIRKPAEPMAPDCRTAAGSRQMTLLLFKGCATLPSFPDYGKTCFHPSCCQVQSHSYLPLWHENGTACQLVLATAGLRRPNVPKPQSGLCGNHKLFRFIINSYSVRILCRNDHAYCFHSHKLLQKGFIVSNLKASCNIYGNPCLFSFDKASAAHFNIKAIGQVSPFPTASKQSPT